MGGEVKMIPALRAAIRGEVPDEEVYAGDFEPERVSEFPSENLPELAWALDLWRWANLSRGMGGRAVPVSGDEVRRRLGLAREWGLGRLAWSREHFMGRELLGRTYPGWHYMGKRSALALALEFGWDDLAADLHGWRLAFLAHAAAACTSRLGREISDHGLDRLDRAAGVVEAFGPEIPWGGRFVAWSGDRSDSRRGSGPDAGKWWGYTSICPAGIWLELELGDREREVVEFNRGKRSAADVTDEGHVVASLRARFGELEGDGGRARLSAVEVEILRRMRDGDVGAALEALEWVRGWRPEVPFRVRRTSLEVGTVSPIGRGSSTLHDYAMFQNRGTGRIRALRADPGYRSDKEPAPKWIGPGSATVEELDGGRLRIVACRDDREFGGPVELVTDGGELELDYTHGPEGLAILFPAPAAPAPAPAPDPAAGGPVVVPPAAIVAPGGGQRRRRGALARLLEALRRLFGGGR